MAVRGKLIVNNIRNVRRNLRRARQANAFDKPAIRAMLGTVSDRIQIPSRTTHKDTGTKVNTYYYFIS